MGIQSLPAESRKAVFSGWLAAAFAVWIGASVAGLWVLWDFQTTPGVLGSPPARWPRNSGIQRTPGLPEWVVFLHPQCPCSRATVAELARVMARAEGKARAHVLALKPKATAPGWEKTDLWRSAAAIPGVEVSSDDGREVRLFQARTSGQTVLYDSNGGLVFSGGITDSRGHAGTNAGSTAVLSILLGGSSPISNTPAFGCALQEDGFSHEGRLWAFLKTL